MSIVERLQSAFSADVDLPEDQKLQPYIKDRVVRSEERMEQLRPSINERYEMWRGNQYAYVDSNKKLNFLPTKTTPTGAGKKAWLSRKSNNLLIDIVAHEVSAVTQRIPSYEVTPTAVDPEKRSAAKTSEQVALYGYDKWNVQLASVKAATHAVVGQEAFAWPYFDNTVGPMINGADGRVVGRGEVKIRVYGAGDVMWEPGIRFEDSPYHIVVQEDTLQHVVNTPGFFGDMVIPDSEITKDGQRGWGKARNKDLIKVYNYLEKPSRSYPVGRWLVIANSRMIAKERPYPVPEGDALIPLSYMVDPDNDRDMGLVQHLLDPMRIYNDAWNKIVEWKNLALNPQIFIAPGVLQGQVITSEPGAVYEIADPKNNVQWREVPNTPQELFQITQDMTSVMARLSAQNDIPSQVEAGKAIQALIERDLARRQSFIAAMATWHARVAHQALYLVQQYYDEPRLLSIKGRWAPEVIRDFKGAQLLGQIDVRVAPGSIEPRTRVAMEQKVLAFADRGWITPEQAMSAIEGGYAAELVTSYDLDIGRAVRIIERLKAGPEALYGTPEAPAPNRMEPQEDGTQIEVPDFMPRLFDNIPVQRGVFEDWMKTEEYESQPQDIQAVGYEIYLQMLNIEAQKDAQKQMAMQAAAEQTGQVNAARGGGSMPDAPSANDGQAGGNLQTPNQPGDQNGPTQQ